jgi:signal transduction histidine kinase
MKLFWKLFITLGIAMTIAMVAAVTMGWQVRDLAIEMTLDRTFENREAIINRAQQALNRGGREELTDWLQQNQNPLPGRRMLIVDTEGQELLGRELTRVEWSLFWGGIRRDMGDNAPPNARGLDDPRWAVYGAARNRVPADYSERLYAPDGALYRAIFVTTELTLLNILTLPVTQLSVVTLAVIMAAGTALLLAKSFASPIVRLQRATRALAAGTLEARVGKPFDQRKDEIGTLARDFDAMAEKIQALVTDKEVLLRDVSHELRSPLARIRVALALAERKSDAATRDDLERIDQETERLDQLVGQILTLARLRSSRLEDHVDVDLSHLVTEVIADAKFEQADASIDFEPVTVPPIQGNAGELTSAIENVLRNAILHSGPAAEVEVSVKRAGPNVVITIADHGPGVPEADLKRLFEPFFRVDPSRDHKQNGYGIGLAIAASIVDRHSGTITARNRPGGGLAVSLSLPASPAH